MDYSVVENKIYSRSQNTIIYEGNRLTPKGDFIFDEDKFGGLYIIQPAYSYVLPAEPAGGFLSHRVEVATKKFPINLILAHGVGFCVYMDEDGDDQLLVASGLQRLSSGGYVRYKLPGKFTNLSPSMDGIVYKAGRTLMHRRIDPSDLFFGTAEEFWRSSAPVSQNDPAGDRKNNEDALWAKVAGRRQTMIAQARGFYNPLLDNVPTVYRSAVESEILPSLRKIYGNQEHEVTRRVQEAVTAGKGDMDWAGLPFDKERIEADNPRLVSILSSLQGEVGELSFLEWVGDRLGQEDEPGFRERFYVSLFRNLYNLALEPGGALNLSPETLLALGLGWEAPSGRDVEDMGAVIAFTNLIFNAQPSASWPQAAKVVRHLNRAARESPERRRVVMKQMRKFTGNGDGPRLVMAGRLVSAFRDADPDVLDRCLADPEAYGELGPAREFAVYLTHEVESLRHRQRKLPAGDDVPVGEGVFLSQLAVLNDRLGRGGLISMTDLEDALRKGDLPPPVDDMGAEILRDSAYQRESGASAAEFVQNSWDATGGRKGKVTVEYYTQSTREGKVFVEEARDDGTGALAEIALLIPRSTKGEGGQVELAGFFGTGKYTFLEGVDRVEIITRNDETNQPYLFEITVTRNLQGDPLSVRLTRVRKLRTKAWPRAGVTVRRIKQAGHTVPELDAMLSKSAWKTFAGLAPYQPERTAKKGNDFTIHFVERGPHGTSRKVRLPFVKDPEIVSQDEFIAVRPGAREPTRFGAFRVWRVPDGSYPSQVVDKRGLRVSSIKPEYLALVPPALRQHVKDLNLTVQIPLPLVRNRDQFAHENDYLPIIQKYTAIGIYKALAERVLTQRNPGFVFEGLSNDWLTNPGYESTGSQRGLLAMAERINREDYGNVSAEELRRLFPVGAGTDAHAGYILLVLLVEVQTKNGTTSLMKERLRFQSAVNEKRARAQAVQLGRAGYTVMVEKPGDDPESQDIVNQAVNHQKSISQRTEDLVVEVSPGSAEEALKFLGEYVEKFFGIEQVLIVGAEAAFAGRFEIFQGKKTMLLNTRLGTFLDSQAGGAVVHAPTAVVTHELAHLLEALVEIGEGAVWNGYSPHGIGFTHQAKGLFGQAKQYATGIALANHDSRFFAEPAESGKDDFQETVGDPHGIARWAKTGDEPLLRELLLEPARPMNFDVRARPAGFLGEVFDRLDPSEQGALDGLLGRGADSGIGRAAAESQFSRGLLTAGYRALLGGDATTGTLIYVDATPLMSEDSPHRVAVEALLQALAEGVKTGRILSTRVLISLEGLDAEQAKARVTALVPGLKGAHFETGPTKDGVLSLEEPAKMAKGAGTTALEVYSDREERKIDKPKAKGLTVTVHRSYRLEKALGMAVEIFKRVLAAA
jgi:hypothetical protein